MKTYGKHQVPMLSARELGDKEIGTEDNNRKIRDASQPNDEGETKSLDQQSASALNRTAVMNYPTVRKHISSLHLKGDKLSTPPIALLKGTRNEQNIHKSASTPSLHTKPPIGKESGINLDRTVPGTTQMLLAAPREKQIAMESPRTLRARLPPLQLPKGPKGTAKETEKIPNGSPNQNLDEGNGMIATVPTHPLPQLKPLEQPKKLTENSSFPLHLPHSSFISMDLMRSSVSLPIASSIGNESNEVLVSLPSVPRRRPSSAGAIPTNNAHNPLPAISAQDKKRGMPFRDGTSSKPRTNRLQWRATVKCALIGGFFTVPVLVFGLMLLLYSDGFSPHSDVSSSSNQSLSTTTVPPLPSPSPTADVNIVGGAIFQPISLQNISANNKL